MGRPCTDGHRLPKRPRVRLAPRSSAGGWRAPRYLPAILVRKTLGWVADLGLDSIEGLNRRPLSEEKPEVLIGYTMSAAQCKDLKKRLEDTGVAMVGCYHDFPPASEFRKVFDWAKEMGIEYLASEPPFDAYATLENSARNTGSSWRSTITRRRLPMSWPNISAAEARGWAPAAIPDIGCAEGWTRSRR